jgi:hypothetical protein
MGISRIPTVKIIRERLWGYLRLVFTIDFLIPILAFLIGLVIRGSPRYPHITLVGTMVLGIILALLSPAILGAAMAGRAFREILSPRILSRWELGAVIAIGTGAPAVVMINYRYWEPLGIWIIGLGLLFFWHWLSLRAGPWVLIFRETVGAFLLVPLPMFFSWETCLGRFFPDREIGLAMLAFGLLALSANLGRAWSETEKPEPSRGSLFGRATLIVGLLFLSFLLFLLGIYQGIFLPQKMLFFQYGVLFAYILGIILYYIGLRMLADNAARNKLTVYMFYGVIIIMLLVFHSSYHVEGVGLRG